MLFWDEEVGQTTLTMRTDSETNDCALLSLFPINFELIAMDVGEKVPVGPWIQQIQNLYMKRKALRSIEIFV